MRILKICLFFLSLNMMAQNGVLNNAEEHAFKSRVIEKANGINSFSAEFMQTKHMKVMDESPESQGKVYYKSPDLLKWEYLRPYDYQILFKDSKLYIMEEGQLSEVDLSSNKLFEKMGELVAGSVNGKILQSDKDFTITYYRDKHNIRARIVPKDRSLSGMFKEIWVNFNSDHLINSVRLVDPSGDYTEIFMKNIKINQSIPPSVFQN
ncbi:MAG: outer membrane lipoprotein carrier protein LolA [Christiangramia sp.]|nr:outer membrane lipoprotein carrier protein LolA [Christiangramia sp.]